MLRLSRYWSMSLSFALPNGCELGAKGQDGPVDSCRLAWVTTVTARCGPVIFAEVGAANPSSVLNAQEIGAFSEVQTVLGPAVASS